MTETGGGVIAPLETPVRAKPMGRFFWLCAVWILAVVLGAVTADWLPLIDPLETDFLSTNLAPNGQFWFGTDALGRDIFSRVIFGARVSLIIGVAVPAISLTLGLFIGLPAGYYRGWVEQVILFYVNVTMAFPSPAIGSFRAGAQTPRTRHRWKRLCANLRKRSDSIAAESKCSVDLATT